MTQCPESLHRGGPLFSTVHYPQFKHHIYTLLLRNTTALLVLCQGNPTRKIICLCDISQNKLMNKLSSFGWLETLWCSWDAAERLCRFCHFCHPEHDDVMKWKHFPRYWPLCGEFTSPRWIPKHKGQWRLALMFPLIYTWKNGWVNNRKTGDLRRHRSHYDVIVMTTFMWNYVSMSYLM